MIESDQASEIESDLVSGIGSDQGSWSESGGRETESDRTT